MKIALSALYFIAAAVMTGLAIPMLGPKFGVLMLALFATPILFIVPSTLILFLLLALSLVLAGVSTYFFKASIQWVVYLTGLAGYFVLVFQLISTSKKQTAVPLAFTFLALYVLSLAFSTAISPPGPYHLLVSIRDYFFLMSAYFLVARMELTETLLKKLWLFLWVCALIQVPVVLYQFFFVAASRVDQTKWDAIVGTFSGSQEGGGDSGNLAIFMFAVLVLTIALNRRGLVAPWKLLVLIISVLIFTAVAEVKVAFVLLAILGLWMLLEKANTALFSRVLVSVATALVMGGLLWSYAEFRQYDGAKQYGTAEERLELSLSYSLDPDSVQAISGSMGRTAALVFWGSKNSLSSNPLTFLVGNGAGSTVVSRQGYGEVAKRYFPLAVSPSAISALLWDTGLIGTTFYLLFVLTGFVHAWGARRDARLQPWMKGYTSAAIPILAFYTLSLPYNKGLISNSPPTQLMFFLFLGIVANWAARRATQTKE